MADSGVAQHVGMVECNFVSYCDCTVRSIAVTPGRKARVVARCEQAGAGGGKKTPAAAAKVKAKVGKKRPAGAQPALPAQKKGKKDSSSYFTHVAAAVLPGEQVEEKAPALDKTLKGKTVLFKWGVGYGWCRGVVTAYTPNNNVMNYEITYPGKGSRKEKRNTCLLLAKYNTETISSWVVVRQAGFDDNVPG